MAPSPAGQAAPPRSEIWPLLKPFVTGSLAGCASVTVVTPMDLIKVRLQVAAREAGPGKGLEEESQTRRAAAMARAVWRAEGPAGFYRGISAIWGRQIVYKGAVLGFYDVFLDRLEGRAGARSSSESSPVPSFRSVVIAGVLAGGVSGFIGPRGAFFRENVSRRPAPPFPSKRVRIFLGRRAKTRVEPY